MVNLSRGDGPKRLAYVAAHTLVVYTEDDEGGQNELPGTQMFLRGHRNAIRSLLASDDRSVVITCDAGPDSQIIIWDIDQGEPRRIINGEHQCGIAAADVTPCGRWFATLNDDLESESPTSLGTSPGTSPTIPQRVRVWDLRDSSDVPVFTGTTLPRDFVDRQTSVKFNPDEPRELVTNGKSSVVFFVPQETEKENDDEHSDQERNDDNTSDSDSESNDNKKHSLPLRCYAPPIRVKDFKQTVGAFTRSAFIGGRCITGTGDGDLVVWGSGGVLPGGSGDFEQRDMRPGDRRGVKVMRAHQHGGVTHLSVVSVPRNNNSNEEDDFGAMETNGTENNATEPTTTTTTTTTLLVTGGSDGNVRFFDTDLRLVAWFDGLNKGGITSVSFVRQGCELQKTETSGPKPKSDGSFAAPDFVLSTESSFIFSITANDFETYGGPEAVSRAVLITKGALEPAVAFAVHPTEPVLCVCGSLGHVWLWNYVDKIVIATRDLTRKGTHMAGLPTAVCYRKDGLGILVGTKGGELKALDANTLWETQAMRFTPDCVERVTTSDDDSCGYGAASDRAGAVSLFRLLGPIHEPSEGHDPTRAFDFIGKHRTHAPETPCVGLAFHTTEDGDVELVSVGSEGRIARFDVKGSTEEDGVDLLESSDMALGGEAAGGDVKSTAMTFLSFGGGPEEDEEPSDSSGSKSDSASDSSSPSLSTPPLTILVADDNLKLRTVDCETLTCLGVACGPAFSDKERHITSLVPFSFGTKTFVAYANASDVVGILALPVSGDPARGMGVVAHPGRILQLDVSENYGDDETTYVFTLGGGGVGFGDSASHGCVLNVWKVDRRNCEKLHDSETNGDADSSDASLASKRRAYRMGNLLEGGANGPLVDLARDAFAYAQLKAQGETATSDREVDTRYGTISVGNIADVFRSLGVYLTEREINDVQVELRYEAEQKGVEPPTQIDFDRFLSLFVNRRPLHQVQQSEIEKAFEIMLDDEGVVITKKSLLEMLKESGEAMSDEELAEIAKQLGGPGASIKDLFPEDVTAKNFTEHVLGFTEEECMGN